MTGEQIPGYLIENTLYREAQLPTKRFREQIDKKHQHFPLLNERLLNLSNEFVDYELNFARDGLPQAQDAENFLNDKYFGGSENHKSPNGIENKSLSAELAAQILAAKSDIAFANEAIVAKYAAMKLHIVHPSFAKLKDGELVSKKELIETSIEQLFERIKQVNEAIDILAEQCVADGFNDIEKIQELALYELHFLNLRNILRAISMYLLAVEGNSCSSDLAQPQLHLEDNDRRRDFRRGAEALSEKLYGKVDRDRFNYMLLKHLEARRGLSAEADTLIDELLGEFLTNVKKETQDSVAKELDALSKITRYNQQRSSENRVAKAWRVCEKNQLVNDNQEFLEVLTTLDSSGIEIKTVIDLLANLRNDFYIHAQKEELPIDLAIMLFDQLQSARLSDVVDAVGPKSLQTLAELYEKLPEKLKDLSLTELEKLLSVDLSGNNADKENVFAISKGHYRPNIDLLDTISGPELALFFQKMLKASGIDARIVYGDKPRPADRKPDEVLLVLAKSTSAAADATKNELIIPMLANNSKQRAIELWCHEVFVHLFSALRVKELAPSLAIVPGSSPANEGLAVASESVVSELLYDETIGGVSLDDPKLFVKLLLRATEKKIGQSITNKYNDTDEAIPYPDNSGELYSIAVGILQGVDLDGEDTHRSIEDAYKILYKIFLVSELINNPKKAELSAVKKAFTTGIVRQTRGLEPWDLTDPKGTAISTQNLVYQAGKGILMEMLIDPKRDFTQLGIGKVLPEHLHYQELFGVNAKTLDPKLCTLDKQLLRKNLGLGGSEG